MRRISLIIVGLLAILFILIQFIPSKLPSASIENEDDLILSSGMDKEVAGILKYSCYDCHSNETKYPWYSYVAPVRWLIVKDINEGRKELNFSEWNKMEKREQIKMLGEIAEEVEEGLMPLPVYTFIHWDARLNEEEREKLSQWTVKKTEEIFGD